MSRWLYRCYIGDVYIGVGFFSISPLPHIFQQGVFGPDTEKDVFQGTCSGLNTQPEKQQEN